jgi:hypothetical protein
VAWPKTYRKIQHEAIGILVQTRKACNYGTSR